MRRLACAALALTLVAGHAHARQNTTGPRRMLASRACFGATLPTVRAVGAVGSNAGTFSPGLPTGTVPGDLLLMFCENSGEGAQTADGWTQAIDVTGATGTRLTVLYRVATETNASAVNDVGDHQLCRIVGVTAGTFCASSPIGPTNSNTQTATGSVSITGTTTTLNNSLVFQASASDLPDAAGTAQFSAHANANLGTLTEWVDNSVTAGNGGALLVMSGTLATAGATGTGTATAATATGVRANATIAINGR